MGDALVVRLSIDLHSHVGLLLLELLLSLIYLKNFATNIWFPVVHETAIMKFNFCC
jgi:hypothetical protein